MRRKILYFTAPWCGPCKMLAPIIAKLRNSIPISKIDVDQNKKFTEEHGVRNIPTMILMEDDKEIGRKSGFQTEQQIRQFYNG